MDANRQALRLQVLIERYKPTQLKILTQVITKLEQAARSVLADENLSDLKHFALSRELTIADQKVQSVVAPVLAEYHASLKDFLLAQFDIERTVWGLADVGVDDVIKSVFATPIGIDGTDRGSILDVFVLSFWNNARDAVFGALSRGSFEKRPNASLMAEIRGTRRLTFQDGISAKIHRAATAINNTAVQHAVSAMRDAMLEGSDIHEILWSSLFEKATCSRCGALDGHVYAVGAGPRSPIHMSCRCMSVPVTKDTSKQYSFTYFDWLKEQDREFVEATIGVHRAQMLLDEGLTVTRFVSMKFDKNFEPISLADLRKTNTSAFA